MLPLSTASRIRIGSLRNLLDIAESVTSLGPLRCLRLCCPTQVQNPTDLGVIVDITFKSSKQVAKVVSKAHCMLVMLIRTFAHPTPVYSAVVHSQLTHCVQACSPSLHCEVRNLEGLQWTPSRVVPSECQLSYEYKLKKDYFFLSGLSLGSRWSHSNFQNDKWVDQSRYR